MLYVLSGPVVQAYSQQYPKVALRVFEGVSQYLEEWLVSGRTDLSLLISGLRPLRNVTMTPLVSEDIFLVGPPDAGLDIARPVSDRKSTRLNSQSLMRISYAVFCLKKKHNTTKHSTF